VNGFLKVKTPGKVGIFFAFIFGVFLT